MIRAIAAIAAAVPGVCGATVLALPAPPNLLSYPNWTLATTLPPRDAFPPDWDYSVHGFLGRAIPPAPAPAPPPTAVFTPPECGQLPALLTAPGTAAATVSGSYPDHPDQILVARPATAYDANATGEIDRTGPQTRFTLWAVTDGPGLIADYRTWLHGCAGYRVATAGHRRTVTTEIRDAPVARVDTALAITRTFSGAGAAPRSYRVEFHPVRGLLLECSTTLTGADGDEMLRLASPTLRKLRGL